MTKIKFCGLTRLSDIQASNALSPDYIGFVFAPASRRYIDPDTAALLLEKLRPSITPVGVFVDEKPETVAALLRRGIIRIAQLHGCEDESYLARLRSLISAPLIKAFSVRTPQDIHAANNSSADYVLLDSGAGGTGNTFDWAIAAHMQKPFFLAGGLNADNICAAIRALHPYGVDISSGIETDGLKDQAKMKKFIKTVNTIR